MREERKRGKREQKKVVGNGFGVAGFILSLILPIAVLLILSRTLAISALGALMLYITPLTTFLGLAFSITQLISKKTKLAVIGLIISIIDIILSVLIFIFFMLVFSAAWSAG